jgi:hypothetical protein
MHTDHATFVANGTFTVLDRTADPAMQAAHEEPVIMAGMRNREEPSMSREESFDLTWPRTKRVSTAAMPLSRSGARVRKT